MDVYYDFIEDGTDIKLGVVVVEDFEVIMQEMKTVQKGLDTNFYHWSLDAMEFAMELVNAEGFDDVCLKNQQKQIFSWLMNDNYKESYDEYFNVVKRQMSVAVKNGAVCTYEIIKGEQNKAKKFLKRHGGISGTRTNDSTSGDLTKLFTSTNKNVVDILSKLRERA